MLQISFSHPLKYSFLLQIGVKNIILYELTSDKRK